MVCTPNVLCIRTFYGYLLKLRHRLLELKYSMKVGFALTVVVSMSYVTSTSTFHSKVMPTVVRPSIMASPRSMSLSLVQERQRCVLTPSMTAPISMWRFRSLLSAQGIEESVRVATSTICILFSLLELTAPFPLVVQAYFRICNHY